MSFNSTGLALGTYTGNLCVHNNDPDAGPEDGLVAELAVEPAARGRGHGTRLVQAAVDTLKADGFTRATWWVSSKDDALRGLLTSTGFAPDGAHQEVGDEDGGHLKLVRLHALIDPEAN